MSDEKAMEIIENLSEELGEKELKIMALEKALEEEKRKIRILMDLAAIRLYKINWLEEAREGEFEWEWCPRAIVNMEEEPDLNFDLMCKVILHYFGGRIMTKKEIEEDIGIDFGPTTWADWDEFYEDKSMDGDMTCLIAYSVPVEDAKYWVETLCGFD